MSKYQFAGEIVRIYQLIKIKQTLMFLLTVVNCSI